MKYNLKDKKTKEIYENDNLNEDDSTMYGEFVTSYFAWIPLSRQKERANELEKMTADNKNIKKMSNDYLGKSL